MYSPKLIVGLLEALKSKPLLGCVDVGAPNPLVACCCPPPNTLPVPVPNAPGWDALLEPKALDAVLLVPKAFCVLAAWPKAGAGLVLPKAMPLPNALVEVDPKALFVVVVPKAGAGRLGLGRPEEVIVDEAWPNVIPPDDGLAVVLVAAPNANGAAICPPAVVLVLPNANVLAVEVVAA